MPELNVLEIAKTSIEEKLKSQLPPSLEQKVKFLSDLYSEISKSYSDFIKENPSAATQEIIEEQKEYFSQLAKLVAQNPDVISAESDIEIDSSKSEQKGSLISAIFQSAPHKNSFDFIISYIKSLGSLENRSDIISTMIKQSIISEEYNVVELFDALTSKETPIPSEEILLEGIRHARSSATNGIPKLALSYLKNGDVDTFQSIYLAVKKQSQKDLRNKNSRSGIDGLRFIEEKIQNQINESISNSSHQTLGTLIQAAVQMERLDDFLVKRSQNISALAPNISNHAQILNAAVKHKFTKTFELLINMGFDPRKRDEGTLNPISYAARDQGHTVLKSYIKTISDYVQKKFGEKAAKDFVSELVNERDENGMNSLSHAIDNKSYLNTIRVLFENGLVLTDEFTHLENSYSKGHAATFSFLLSKIRQKVKSNNSSEENLVNETFSSFSDSADSPLVTNPLLSVGSPRNKDSKSSSNPVIGAISVQRLQEQFETRGDFAIESALLDHLRNSEPNATKVIKKLKDSLQARLGSIKEEDIFKLCETSGEESLKLYRKELESRIPDFDFKKVILSFDSQQNSPLFYAIYNNSYDSLITYILESGANPNHVRESESNETEIDALSLAISHVQPETVSLILNLCQNQGISSSPKAAASENYNLNITPLSEDSVLRAFFQLNEQETNASLFNAFFSNLSSEFCTSTLAKISHDHRDQILAKAIMCNSSEETFAKLKKSLRNIGYNLNSESILNIVRSSLLTAVETQDIDKFSLVFREFPEIARKVTIQNSKSSENKTSDNGEQKNSAEEKNVRNSAQSLADERKPLLDNSQNKNSYSATSQNNPNLMIFLLEQVEKFNGDVEKIRKLDAMIEIANHKGATLEIKSGEKGLEEKLKASVRRSQQNQAHHNKESGTKNSPIASFETDSTQPSTSTIARFCNQLSAVFGLSR